MTCQESIATFVNFIDDKLSPEDLEQFLDHMGNCKSCQEEFEVYYTVIMGMRILEENPNNHDIYLSPTGKLESASDWLKKYKIKRVIKRSMFVLIILFAVFLV